jgi:hypothetical protein
VTVRARWSIRVIVLALLAFAVAIALLGRHSPAPAQHFAGTATTYPDVAWDSLFQSYGNTSNAWNGGDGAQSLLLPDGATVWFFADSYLGPVAADGVRSAATTGTAHNTAVLYRNGLLGPTFAAPAGLFGYTSGVDYTWVKPPSRYPVDRYELINGDQVLDDGTVYKFYQLADRDIHPDGFEYKLVGTVIEAFTVGPGTDVLTPVRGTPKDVEDTAGSDPILWGAAVVTVGHYIYLYGVKPYNGGSAPYPVYLARVPVGGLAADDAWQYFDGTPRCPAPATSWVKDPAAATPLRTGASAGFSVTNVDGTYVLLTNDSISPATSNDAVAYYAQCPTGFSPASPEYMVDQSVVPNGYLAYEYRIVPQFSSGSNVLVSYSENTVSPGSNLTDGTIYRPRFLDVKLPGIHGAAGFITEPS